jgi:hypothetical protein
MVYFSLLAISRSKILENLSKLQHVPSIPFTERPPDTELHEMEDEELDVRDKGHTWDGEFSDSDSDSEGFEHHANHRALASSEPAFPRLSLYYTSPGHPPFMFHFLLTTKSSCIK